MIPYKDSGSRSNVEGNFDSFGNLYRVFVSDENFVPCIRCLKTEARFSTETSVTIDPLKHRYYPGHSSVQRVLYLRHGST